ncbi:nitroreductase family protein [Trichoderma barbatum]
MADTVISSPGARRSVYLLPAETDLSIGRLEEIIRNALLTIPSAFNTQSARIVILVGDYHYRLREIDPSPYEALGSFKMYADKFEGWRKQTSGMHQLLIWSTLALEGVGGNLQHYNLIIDDELLVQLAFGNPVRNAPPVKEKRPLKDQHIIYS